MDSLMGRKALEWESQWAWDGSKWVLRAGTPEETTRKSVNLSVEASQPGLTLRSDEVSEEEVEAEKECIESDEGMKSVIGLGLEPETSSNEKDAERVANGKNAADVSEVVSARAPAIVALEIELKGVKFKLKVRVRRDSQQVSGLHLLVGGQDHQIPLRSGKAKCKTEVPEGIHEAMLVTEDGEVLGRWRVDAGEEGV